MSLACLTRLSLFLAFLSPNTSAASVSFDASVLEMGFRPIPFADETEPRFKVNESEKAKLVDQMCQDLTKSYRKYGWKGNPCAGVTWETQLKSPKGHPLIYAVFGSGSITTLILGGVHPDELTPIHLSFRLAKHLADNPSIYEEKSVRVVVAPLVNPDGFLRTYPTRTNANRVDLNRNFPTKDWYEKAHKSWRTKRKALRRYFPGYFPNTEIETIFQGRLIDSYHPSKIFSIHAPLGFYDYDGPGSQQKEIRSSQEERAKEMVKEVARKSRNYRIVDGGFFPGSLGNYAGNERKMPTLTLELQTTEPSKVDDYWAQFLPGIIQSIQFPYRRIH